MAFVYMPPNAKPFVLTVTFVDRSGKKFVRQWDMRGGEDSPGVVTNALNSVNNIIIPRLQAISACKIIGYELAYRWIENALVLPTTADAEGEKQAFFAARITNKPHKQGFVTIPGPKPGIFLGTSGEAANLIDANDQDVANFMALFNNSQYLYLSDCEQWDGQLLRGIRKTIKASG